MDQQMDQPKVSEPVVSHESQTFNPNAVPKAPTILKIIAVLMMIGGAGMVFIGIPMLFFFGLGIIPIGLGILNIKYGFGIFKMKYSAYRGAMILQGLIIVFNVFSLIRGNFENIIGTILTVVVIIILYSYRQKFV